MTKPIHYLPLALAALSLAACSSQNKQPASSTSAITPPQKAIQQVTDFTAGTDSALANVDATRQANSSPTPLPAKPAPSRPFPIKPATSITPIADHSSGVPSSLGAIPPSPATIRPATTQPETTATSQPAPASEPAPAIATTAPTPPKIETSAATQPSPTIEAKSSSPLPSNLTLDKALDTLHKQFATHPNLNNVLALALLDISNGKPPDPAATASLSPTDQKLFNDLVAALQGMINTNSPRLSERAAPLIQAAKTWQADADLSLPKLSLASRVDSFGIYTPVPATFTQGIPHTVLIYCEVANFTSQKGDDGWFTTRLSQQETLITDDGILAWRPNPEEVEDHAMNQRHDFYLVKKLTLPETLAAGKYTLRMKVIDHTSNKTASLAIPLEITPN